VFPRPVDAATGEVVRFGSGTAAENYWFVSSGEIRITASSESRLAGTFELAAERFFSDAPPGPIALTGSFDAIFMDARPLRVAR
jgi:hypothetical protein